MPTLRRWLVFLWAATFLAGVPLLAWAQPTTQVSTSRTGEPFRFRGWQSPADASVGARLLTSDEREFLDRLPVVRVGLALPAFQPYEVVADNGEISGIHVQILWQLARAFGIRLEPVVFNSFPAMLEAAQERKVDLLMSLGVNTERARFLEFTLGATPMVSAVFRRTAAQPTPPMELERGRYAIERSNIANDHVRRRYPDAGIMPVETRSEALRRVHGGDADFYIGNLLPTLDQMQRERITDIEVLQLAEYGTGYYHYAVRKDWAALARILNKGIGARATYSPPELDRALAALARPMPEQRRWQLPPEHWRTLMERPVWRVGAVRDLIALNEADSTGRHQGIAAEYTEAIARQLGVGIEVVPFASVADMLDAARAGQVDVVPLLTRTPAREQDFAFSRPYIELPYMIVGRRDGPLYWSLESLRGKRLALARQHPLRDLLAARWPDIRVIDVGGGQGAMDAVAFGLADAAVEVKLYANLRINADADSLRLLGQVEELPAQFHFAVPRRSQALVPLIDGALAEIPDGERARMLRRWVAYDLPPVFPWRRYVPLAGTVTLAAGVLLAAGLWWRRRLRTEQRSRRASEEQLADITAHLPCLAYRSRFDADGRLLGSYHSRGGREVLGIELDPTLTLIDNLAARVRPQDLDAAREAGHACFRHGTPVRMTVRYEHPDGRPRWLYTETVGRPAGPTGGVVMTGYIVDVTADFELQAKLAQDAQARHLLLASASHELRAPTHTLSLALQAIQNGAGNAAGHLAVARAATRTLGELIGDVLDAARLDEGALQLRPQDCSPRELLQEAAAATEGWAAEKGLVFTWHASPDVPERAWLDPLRLQQIITNLLSNAVKYTERGHVHLSADVQAGQLVIEVDDSGVGIDPKRLERLFTPYAAADGQPLQPRQGSSGLGLSIARRLAELMGGGIELRSMPGQGTAVVLRVPLPQPASAAAIDAAPHAAPLQPVHAQRVLVCDDDPTSRLLMTMMLQCVGYDVDSAHHGAAALERWRRGDIGAVVTDMDMPGMPGEDLIQAIRKAEFGADRHTRLVVCSGSAPGAVGPASAAPYDAHIVKPVDMTVLTDTLRALGLEPRRDAVLPPG